jgi:hypothetical protein
VLIIKYLKSRLPLCPAPSFHPSRLPVGFTLGRAAVPCQATFFLPFFDQFLVRSGAERKKIIPRPDQFPDST